MNYEIIADMPVVNKILDTAAREIFQATGVKVVLSIQPDVQFDEARDTKILKQLVTSHFDISWNKILSPTKAYDVIDARHTYIFIAHNVIGRSLKNCASDCGRNDHTTAWHAVEKIKHFYDIKDKLTNSIELIKY